MERRGEHRSIITGSLQYSDPDLKQDVGSCPDGKGADSCEHSMLFAGLQVAALTATPSGMPNCTAFFIQSNKLVAEPAMVPSFKVARRPFLITGCPPSSYSPSSIPVARIASLIKIMRSLPNMRKALRMTDGWMWMPSQMISAIACGQSAAAPIMPGSRWCSGGMALNRWVTWLAPAAKAFSAISYDAVECPSEIATVSLNSRINASEPGSSGAIVMMRILFPLAAESRRNMAASGACR